MSVNQAQQQINSAEFAEWVAYSSIEPFGEERADLRNAITSCLIANTNRGKNQRPFKVKDFMPKFGKHKEQTWQDMKGIFNAFKKVHNEFIKHG